MKAAKHTVASGARKTCGTCASVVKLKNDPDNVACVVHLQVMPVNHVADCEHHDEKAVTEGAPR
jgi:hypothetical protein